jgi:hypothetical protein
MQVIGLTGFAGVGKSEVANYLVGEHGFTRLSFAAPLKKMLRTLNPIVGTTPSGKPVRLEIAGLGRTEQGLKESQYGDEYRRLLQVLGTDCIRAVDENFWVNAAVAQMTDPDGKYVFDDVRFPNEAETIEHYNEFGLWNIQRPGYEAINGHASEHYAGKMGELFVLTNNRTLEMFQGDIDLAVVIYLGGVASASI